MVMIVCAVIALIPGATELLHRQMRGHGANRANDTDTRQFTKRLGAAFLGPQRREDQILFGVHDGQQVPQAARGVIRRIHMDVQPATGVDHRPSMVQRPHNLLQLAHFGIVQHRRVEFDFVSRASGWFLTPTNTLGGLDTAVIDEPPRLPVRVLDLPGVIQA